MKNYKCILTSLFILFSISFTSAQYKTQGYQSAIKQAIIDSNNITTVLYNYGSIGKPNFLTNVADLKWKGLGYMFEFGPLAAAEVVNKNGDTLHITDDSFLLPSQGTYSPDGSQKWGWLPDSGYANPNQDKIATKDNPATWPADWKSWPQFPGDSNSTAVNEVYYVMDDYSNQKFDYYPFPNDTNKRGLGLRAEVKVYQYGKPLDDALIIRYKLTNESPNDLKKVYFGFQGDPHIGGAADYSDDRLDLYVNHNNTDIQSYANNTIYMWDNDFKGMNDLVPEYLSFKFLETPNDAGLTSMHALQFTNSLPNVPKNSKLMWNLLSSGIDSTNDLYKQPGDNVINFGTGPFELASGQTKYITLIMFLSNNYDDMLTDAENNPWYFNWPNIEDSAGSAGGNYNYKVSLKSFNSSDQKGTVAVNWDYKGNDQTAKAFLQFSSDNGLNWNLITTPLNISDGSYQWNTSNLTDGKNYLLRIVAFNPANKKENYYSVIDNKFTINNPVDAKPEITLNTNLKDSVITSNQINVSFKAEDADNSNLNLKISIVNQTSGKSFTLDDLNTTTGGFIKSYDITNIANAENYFLKIRASDGTKDSTVTTGPFQINSAVKSFFAGNIIHLNGNATPQFYLQILDTSKTTSDSYKVTFNADDPQNKTFSVIDFSKKKQLITDYPLSSGLSTPAFDGIKLTVIDHKTELNELKTGFNHNGFSSIYNIVFPPMIGNPKIETPNDWDIIFNSMDTTSNGDYVHPGDTVMTSLGNKIITPFNIVNTTVNAKADYIIFVKTGTKNLSPWNDTQNIILRPQDPTGATVSYQVNFNFSKGITPTEGDTLHIVTYKALTSDDVFLFAVDSNKVLSGVNNIKNANDYSLEQNYPNPFNPTTTIKYQIPRAGNVTLLVYNILGEKVQTLVNGYQNKGTYRINFNGAGLASGVYIYRLQSGNYSSIKKMMLLK